MSVGVNLLPRETEQRQAEQRQRLLLVGGLVLVLVLLAAVSVWQNGRISQAEDRLADERAVLAAVEQEQQELADFADLEQRIRRSQDMTQQAMGTEVSMAGILQDVAAVMPSDAQLDSLTVNVAPEADPDAPATIGSFVAVGRSLTGHAPGLERLLLEFDKVAAFRDLYFTNSVLEDPEEPYTTFTVESVLGPEVFTDRYTDGTPE